jgi:heme exporter protein A
MQGLTVKGLDCVRGERLVFAGVALAVNPGRALLLSGANGSGKSSLLRILAGLLQPAAGTLAWEGEDIATDTEAHRRRIAYIGHADPVKPGLTVCENLEFWARLYGLELDIEPALYQFGIEQLADMPARYLSAGQRRRLTLARLAVGQNSPAGPLLWLLDEPAAGLDPGAVAMLANSVLAHLANDGVAVIASHGGRLDEALDGHTDRLVLQDAAP